MATITKFTGNTTVNNYHNDWLKSAVNFAHHVYKVHSENGLLSDALGIVRYNELLVVNGVDPPPFDIPPPPTARGRSRPLAPTQPSSPPRRLPRTPGTMPTRGVKRTSRPSSTSSRSSSRA